MVILETIVKIAEKSGPFASLIAVITTLYSAVSWWRLHKKEKIKSQRVSLRLVEKGSDGNFNKILYCPPFPLFRRQVSRAEVIGVLGMIPTEGGKRFDIAYLNTEEYWRKLEAVSNGRASQLDIFITPEERKIFNQSELAIYSQERVITNDEQQ